MGVCGFKENEVSSIPEWEPPFCPSCRVVPGRLSSVSSSTLDTIDPEDRAAPFVCPTETLSQNKALISVRWLFAVFLETSYRTKITPG